MKAVRWTSERKPGLKLHDEAAPKPGPHEVVVRVHAASLNFRDQAILDDAYGGPTKPNGVPLSDGAGEVVAVGSEVTRTKVGDRVSAFEAFIRDHMPRYRHLFAIENDAVHISVNVPVRFAASVRDAALHCRVTPDELIFTAVSHELEMARESAA